MSMSVAIARLKSMQEELEAATGVTEVELPGPPAGQVVSVAGEFSCERLELLVQEHIKAVTDMIKAKTQEISALISNYAPILSLPSDPLKILKWAKKVVLGMAEPAIAAAIQHAIEIAQLAAAMAGLIGAVAAAAARLATCITNLVQDSLKSVMDELMNGAIALYDQATGIYESLKDQALDQLGFNEILELSNTVKGQVDTLKSTVGDIESSVDSMSNSVDVLSGIEVPAT